MIDVSQSSTTYLRCAVFLATVLFALGLAAPGRARTEGDGAPEPPESGKSLRQRVEHHSAKNGDVKIHFVALGKGPLVVLLHGFPDFWYSWRYQMDALARTHRVVAVDLRGYNKSDHPEGEENYDMSVLVEDVAAVIRASGEDRATIVGHDWGGAIAWSFAMSKPAMTDALVVLNLPHPRGLMRELATNERQRANSKYARDFQEPDSHELLSADSLSLWVLDAADRKHYVEAFERSSFRAMLDYYRRNYPREPYAPDASPVVKVKAPVLVFHGLKDPFLLAGALDRTWEWVERDLTLVTVPGAGHWVHHDARDFVKRRMLAWLRLVDAERAER